MYGPLQLLFVREKGFDSGVVIVVFTEIFRFINIANSV